MVLRKGPDMVYDLKMKSLKELFEELKGLEVDSGVRTFAEFNGRKSLVFITKHSGKYALWIRDRRRRKGDCGIFKEFHDRGDLSKFLARTLERPLRAYIY